MGKIFCLMGKSSTGKDTIFKRLTEDEELNLKTIVSYTTRPIRDGEEEGKEYFFATGKHVAIVKKIDGKYKYLELQSAISNDWNDFDRDTLKYRFGCQKSRSMRLGGKSVKRKMKSYCFEVDSFKDNEEFREILGYINTATDKLKKGASGSVK